MFFSGGIVTYCGWVGGSEVIRGFPIGLVHALLLHERSGCLTMSHVRDLHSNPFLHVTRFIFFFLFLPILSCPPPSPPPSLLPSSRSPSSSASLSVINPIYLVFIFPRERDKEISEPGRALPAHKRPTCILGRAALPVVPECGTGKTIAGVEPLIKLRRMFRPSCKRLVRVGKCSCAREEFR